MKISKFRLSLAFTAIGFIGIFLASPGNAIVRTDSCGTVGTLQNGGFETPTISGTYQIRNDASISGDPDGVRWLTTASDHQLEIWRNPTPIGISAAVGSQSAELNANQFAGLYQDVSTVPGQRILWSLQHRGRSGTESMRVLIGTTTGTTTYAPQSGSLTLNGTLSIQNARQSGTTTDTQNIQDGTSGWSSWSGNYVVPSGQTTTRFLFISYNPSSGGSGNLLDDVAFTPFLACPVTRNVTFGSTDSLNVVTQSGVSYGVGHSLSSVSNSTNPTGGAGSGSISGNTILFNPVAAGSNQTLDYTISVSSLGQNYTDEARITYNVSATVPGAPTGLSATTTGPTAATSSTTGASATISWTAPTNNGGVAISDYVIEYKQGTGAWQTFADGVSTSTSATVTGLSGASTTLFRVSAKNDGSGYTGPGTTGTGATSSELSVNAWVCSNLNQFSNMTGMILWLRADCVNGTPTQPSDNSDVDRWEDLSGSNNDATARDGSTVPTFQNDASSLINSQPVINFTRTSDTDGSVYLVDNIDIRATSLPDVSIFVVYKPRREDNDESEILGVWGNDDGGWDRFFLAKFQNFDDDGLFSRGLGSNLENNRIENSAVHDTTRLLTAIYDGDTSTGSNLGPTNESKIYFGSTLIRSITDQTHISAALPDLYIGWDGDGSAFRGDIAEFIVFNSALSSDLPSINEYLNSKYDLGFSVTATLPSVVMVDPRVNSVNFPGLTLGQSTNAMVCFSQVADSSGTALSGSATLSVSRSSSVSGVTENTSTNLWRYSGARADVDTQIDSIQISSTNSNPLASTASKWLKVHVTSATSSSTNCTDSQVDRIVEIRPINLDSNLTVDVSVN
ncbi:MAG: hypothetical protein RL228_672 [Actinomycetota bacterium]